MDGMYGGYHPTAAEYSDKALLSPDPYPNFPSDYGNGDYLMMPTVLSAADRSFPIFGSDELLSGAASSTPPLCHQGLDIADQCNYNYSYSDYNNNNNNPGEDDVSGLIKARIASHPRYPRLLDAYIDCQKVGAPPEMASLLDEIRREKELYNRDAAVLSTCYGPDPELDEFMETYCDVLLKYKSDLEKPFDEASRFLSKVEVQLRNLCTGASIRAPSDEGAVSSDEELSGGELDIHENQPSVENRDLKDRLLRRFGSHIGSLKLEFSKKKKKGKLPKEARQELLEWWNVHYKWPYPTEADKIQLAESTGLDQKQINNWFINQRKRHWKPSENMQFAVMNSLSGQFYTDDD